MNSLADPFQHAFVMPVLEEALKYVVGGQWGFRRIRTAFRDDPERYRSVSDAGISIVPEVFGFVK